MGITAGMRGLDNGKWTDAKAADLVNANASYKYYVDFTDTDAVAFLKDMDLTSGAIAAVTIDGDPQVLTLTRSGTDITLALTTPTITLKTIPIVIDVLLKRSADGLNDYGIMLFEDANNYIDMRSGSGDLHLLTRADSTTTTENASSGTVDWESDYVRFRIIASTASVKMFVDDTEEAESTTNIPDGAMTLQLRVHTENGNIKFKNLKVYEGVE